MPPSTRRADYRRYRALLTERPALFQGAADGVRILTDEDEIKAAERIIARRNRQRGLPPASASVGVLAEDSWVLFLRDAIRFPDGSLGTHNRVIYSNLKGVGILAVSAGRIALIRIFRHAMGRWLLEIPRGAVEDGDSLETTVRREVAEEIGAIVTRMVPLGQTVSDTSLCNGLLDLYYAEIGAVGAPQLSEGIAAVHLVTPAEFEDLLRRGEMVDGHAIAAFTQARLRGLLP